MRVEPLLIVAALLLASASNVRAVQQTVLPAIDLGYSPSTLVPLPQGTPVYTVGDELWLSSAYNSSLKAALYPPGTGPAVSVVAIDPRSVDYVYTFAKSDQSGQWSLVLVSGTVPVQVIPVSFEQPPTLTPPILQLSSIFPNGTLLTNFRMNLGNGYNGEVCVVGSTPPTQVSLPFPSSEGSGVITLSANGTTIGASSTPSGVPNARSTSADFWVEMYYPYSYASGTGIGQLITRDVLVARTNTIALNSSLRSSSTLQLENYTNLRSGRYDLRAYFRDSSGLTVQEATLLWAGSGPWLWLGGCISSVTATSAFSFNAPLTGRASTWPAAVYVMLDVGGVEGSIFAPLPLNLTAVHLTTGGWGASLPKALSVSIAQNPAVVDSVAVNGTIYLDLRSIPVNISVLVSTAGSRAESLCAVVTASRSEMSVSMALGEVEVYSGVPKSLVTLVASGSRASSAATGITDAKGSTSFLAVPDNYSLMLQYGNFTTTAIVQVLPGKISTINVEVPQVVDYTPAYILLAIGAVGVVLNVLLWRRVFRTI